MTRRVAAVDCGTNSIRLLIADVDPDRATLRDVDRRMEIVRLGQGVDTTGRLAPEALDRTLKALHGYAELIGGHRAEAVRMVATSATRDAANADEFVACKPGTEGLLAMAIASALTKSADAGEYAFTTSLTTPALVRRDLLAPGAPPASAWGAHGLRLFTVTR